MPERWDMHVFLLLLMFWLNLKSIIILALNMSVWAMNEESK